MNHLCFVFDFISDVRLHEMGKRWNECWLNNGNESTKNTCSGSSHTLNQMRFYAAWIHMIEFRAKSIFSPF